MSPPLREQDERNMLEASRTMAKMARTFYDECRTQDFTPEEAMALTSTWLVAMVRPAARREEDK